jgi:hypothetical protein
MTIVVAVVAALTALIGAIVLTIRAERRRRAAAAVALDRLAASLGAQRMPRGFKGTRGGRAFAMGESSVYGSGGTSPYLDISVETGTTTTFELHPQQSALAARLVGDVELGDAEFDKWFILRTNDPSSVAKALPPDIRQQMIAWRRRGWLHRVWVKDGRLCFQGGSGIRTTSDVARVDDVLRALEHIATALE